MIRWGVLLLCSCSLAHALSARQKTFIENTAQALRRANAQVEKERALVFNTHFQKPLSKPLKALAKRYQCTTENTGLRACLLMRIAPVPIGLGVAQAINESGWGHSPLSLKTHNLFGLWCHQKGCGIAPKQAKPGPYYAIKQFPSTEASAHAYLHTLNTYPQYAQFRATRAQLSCPKSLDLVHTILHYSELGKTYVTRLQTLIERERLEQYDRLCTEHALKMVRTSAVHHNV